MIGCRIISSWMSFRGNVRSKQKTYKFYWLTRICRKLSQLIVCWIRNMLKGLEGEKLFQRAETTYISTSTKTFRKLSITTQELKMSYYCTRVDRSKVKERGSVAISQHCNIMSSLQFSKLFWSVLKIYYFGTFWIILIII